MAESPTVESLASDSKACFDLFVSMTANDKTTSVESACSLLQQAFKSHPICRSHTAIAFAIFSLIHKKEGETTAPTTTASSETNKPPAAATSTETPAIPEKNNNPVQELVRTMANADTEFAQCLVEYVADGKFLESIEGITELTRKIRATNTTVFYRQIKFTLLRDEPEGYSKLLLAYVHNVPFPMVESVMGTFHLDPVRCLDLAIDCITHQLGLGRQEQNADPIPKEGVATALATLARTTNKLPQLLAFKLAHHNNNKQQQQPPSSSATTSITQLFHTIHWLCEQHILHNVAQVLPYNTHDESYRWESVVETTAAAVIAQQRQQLQSQGRVRLTSTTKDPQQQDTETMLAPVTSLWIVRFLLQIMKKATTKEAIVATWNQVIFPLSSDWSNMAILFPESIGVAILDALSAKMQPWLDSCLDSPWQKKKGNGSDHPTVEDILTLVSEPLVTVRESGCISKRPALFLSICKLLAQACGGGGDTKNKSAADNPAFFEFLHSFLLPSLSAFPANPVLNHQVWALLETLRYQDRYLLYQSWQESARDNESNEHYLVWLAQAEASVLKDARYSLRRLSKDTVRELSRGIAKCCFRCPIIVFTTILNQIESYDNLVNVMIEACRFVGPLGWDVLGYCILQRLTAARRNRYKESGVHASQWLQSLEQFTGAFYKRYPTAEFQGLVTYVRSRLEEGKVLELGMLGALVKTVGGWAFRDYSAMASLTVDQLNGMSGSVMLQRQTVAFGIVERIDWIAAKQVQTVLRKDGVDLLILLTQLEYQIAFSNANDNKPVKLIGDLVDKCRVLGAVLLDFLTNEQVEESAMKSYTQALPSIPRLMNDYKMDAAAIWKLHRPIMRKETQTDATSDSCFTSMIPTAAWSHMCVALYKDFFAHTLHDIYFPQGVYDTEIARLDKEVESLTHHHKATPGQPGADDKLAYNRRVVEDLRKEKKAQSEHVATVQAKIKSKIGEYFVVPPEGDSNKNVMMMFFVHCVFPRCMQGPDDALYCAKFMEYLHKWETPGFGLLHLYDSLITILSRSLYGMTEGEAAFTSILLLEIWEKVNTCRYDKKIFAAEFPSESFEDYKNLFNKWHASLGATCLGCLGSSEYIHLRNCLVVLARLCSFFPTKPKLGNMLLKALDPLQVEGNTMADIRAAAKAYSMQLTQARSGGCWKEEDRATVEDRENKIKAAAEQRQKQSRALMAELKRDQEDIDSNTNNNNNRSTRGHHEERRRTDTAERRPAAGGNPPPPPPANNSSNNNAGDRRQRDRVQPEPRREERRRDDRRPENSRKRSHPPSPTEQGEAIEEPPANKPHKRLRGDPKEEEGEDSRRRHRRRGPGGRR